MTVSKKEVSKSQMDKLISRVKVCEDKALLRQWIDNAHKSNANEIEDAAFRRLIEISPMETDGPLERDMWRSIYALEQVLSLERSRTTRLARTRQKIARVGMFQTVSDLASAKKISEGFQMLISRKMPELTAEAVVLRHPEEFPADVIASAREKLESEGIDTSCL